MGYKKLYGIHFYIKGQFYCESSGFFKEELKEDLKKYPEAYLIEDNDIHEIWRVDIKQ